MSLESGQRAEPTSRGRGAASSADAAATLGAQGSGAQGSGAERPGAQSPGPQSSGAQSSGAQREQQDAFEGIMETALDDVLDDVSRAAAEESEARRAAAKASEAKAYEDAVKKAFGGKMGMADAGLPAVCFLIVYTATNSLNPAVIGSVAVALVMFAIRLLRRETLQHALSGLFGVLVCAAFAKFSGHAQNYYLPGILINLGSFLLFAGTALARWPIVGLMIGPITGEMTTWKQVPGRLRAFTNATWLLAALFAVKLAVQVPLYLTHHTTALGVMRLVLGYPPYLACLYFAWQMIKNAPPPVMPESAEETEAAGAAGEHGKSDAPERNDPA